MMFADPLLPIVAPRAWHAGLTTRALRAGLAVIMSKTTVTTTTTKTKGG